MTFAPARVFLHDTNGIPVLVDLAAMREAIRALGGDPARVNPVIPAELTVDHSVVTDVFGRSDAMTINVTQEYERNDERYRFLKWGQEQFQQLSVVPPGTGIMHQINLEYLASVVVRRDGRAFPDTLVGTDSHTTMINGLGVLAWGVGGIEAEAAMLGLPVSTLIPPVVGLELTGELRPTVTATDLVLTIAELLRTRGVVGSFVEFTGPSVGAVRLADRATLANMSPEFGSTCAIFPIDQVTLDYLRFTGRADEHVAIVERYAKEQGLWHDPAAKLRFDSLIRLDLSTVEPSIAGPRRPQDRVTLASARSRFRGALSELLADRAPIRPGDDVDDVDDVDEASRESFPASDAPAISPITPPPRRTATIEHGAVAIAAITSCTNTSNPSVMVAAGLLARNAVAVGLTTKPWVKTSLAPGSKVVTDYLRRSGLDQPLEHLGFPHGGLRVHDLHRQFRPVAPGRRRGDRRPWCARRRRAVGQSELRRPDPQRRRHELPRIAAPRSGVCPRRFDGRRPGSRTAGRRPLGKPGLPERAVAVGCRGRGGDPVQPRPTDVHPALRRRVPG